MSTLEGGGLWKSRSWVFSNSDNSGGSVGKSEIKKPPESSSNSPTVVTASAPGQKRGRNAVSNNTKSGGGGGGGGGEGGGGESDHEIHIWTERERRKRMRNMFSSLHALLPQLPSKADKSTIVDEAVNYIQTLQHTLQKLQKQKLERLQGAAQLEEPTLSTIVQQANGLDSREAVLAENGKNWKVPTNSPSTAISNFSQFSQCFQTWSSPNVVVSVSGDDAHINICTPKKPGLLSTIFYVLEKHNLEVITVHVSSDQYRSMFMIHAHASEVSDQFPDAVAIEEIYKLAVGEMILWIS